MAAPLQSPCYQLTFHDFHLLKNRPLDGGKEEADLSNFGKYVLTGNSKELQKEHKRNYI